jgi:hypothetical protein
VRELNHGTKLESKLKLVQRKGRYQTNPKEEEEEEEEVG